MTTKEVKKSYKAVFTLGAQALVPGHRHKMVLCSDTRYCIYSNKRRGAY